MYMKLVGFLYWPPVLTKMEVQNVESLKTPSKVYVSWDLGL